MTRSIGAKIANFSPSFSPVASQKLLLNEAEEETRYILTTHGQIFHDSQKISNDSEQPNQQVLIPQFRPVSKPKKANGKSRKRKTVEPLTDESFVKRHIVQERMERKIIRRHREIEEYKSYMAKLKKEFPSHFSSKTSSIYRKQRAASKE